MKVLACGGGTLGSVTPLLAVVEELQSRHSCQLVWWGTRYGPEKQLVIAAGFTWQTISAGKLRRYLSFNNLLDLFKVGAGFVQAFVRLLKWRPDIVLTAGGFVAVPVGWAAWLLGIPVMIHQQDVRPGLANKLLTPVASLITVTLAGSLNHFPRHKAVLTGNAVRRVFTESFDRTETLKQLGLADKPTVAIFGGGTGSQFLNDLVARQLPQLIKLGQLVHITGLTKKGAGAQPGYYRYDLLNKIGPVLQLADVVVSRAGMGFLSEAAALAKAVLVVPLPDSHQLDNAQAVSQAQAGLVIKQSDLTGERLVATLSQLLDDEASRRKLGFNLHNLINTGGAVKIANEVERVIKIKF